MKDKTILITGASAGFGEATAKLLAGEGANLILVARRKDRLDALKQELESEHDISVSTHKVDLGDIEAIEKFFEDIKDQQVDALINNAGLALGRAKFEDYDWEDFNRMIDINIKALTRVAQLTIPHLKETKGHIVNIGSVAGVEAYEGGSVYGGTKAFVKIISKALRIDLMGTGIRVTNIAPGAADTEFSNVRFKGDDDAARKVYEGWTPLYAEDIANAVQYVLSQPPSVNIDYIEIMPTAQASAVRFAKNG